jgi:gas vesicle structural protein
VPRISNQSDPSVADQLLDTPDSTMLDLLDRLLDKGVMATGDVTLGVAGVDLIFLRLSALLCAADRLVPLPPSRPRRHRGGAGASRRARPASRRRRE